LGLGHHALDAFGIVTGRGRSPRPISTRIMRRVRLVSPSSRRERQRSDVRQTHRLPVRRTAPYATLRFVNTLGLVTSRSDRVVARREHWDAAYVDRGAEGVSWFQKEPRFSLELFDALGITSSTAVIDIGGGASRLVDRLVQRGYEDLTVLDLSDAALEAAQRRLPAGAAVRWIHQDLLTWKPDRRWDVWHDRAVFHFLVDPDDQDRYLRLLRSVISPDGAVVIATFASDGPDYCSGLPVARYSADRLAALLGETFAVVEERREIHTTPAGVRQPFTWIAARSMSTRPTFLTN
jgi:2-polyprenyl-3-methyl-5-hydroxy-6-metoxy-1,4-benzoquinol methylase